MNDADLQERMQLAIERISEIKEEDQTIWDTLAKMDAGAKNLKTYFDSVAEFILYVYDVYEIVSQPDQAPKEVLHDGWNLPEQRPYHRQSVCE